METTATAPTAAPRRRGSMDYHPLEVIPYFQRFAPSPWRDLIYTLLWNTLLGILFWLVSVAFSTRNASVAMLGWNVVMANIIGYTIHALFMVGAGVGLEHRMRNAGRLAAVAYYAGASTMGVLIGWALSTLVLNQPLMAIVRNPRWIGIIAFSCVLISSILAAIFFARERGARAEAELERERLRSERIERQAALANLRALQAQIEPHFLFNTLANVASLIDSHPELAKRMVESFNRFLRASLAATRSDTTTLGEEGRLIGAYLDVLQVRMGQRLGYTVEVPPELAAYSLPPMLLQPLAENAIKHGLEPKVEGGTITFAAREERGEIVVEVADTGVGFAPTTRGGVGLSNLRSRLALLYGGRARLDVIENSPSGTRVVVRLPR
jgi:signal transduction histidine kinase